MNQKKKHAVFIVNSLQNGGAERVVCTQANFLQRKGIQVTIIFLRKWIQYELDPQIRTVFLTQHQKFSAYMYCTETFRLVRKLNKILHQVKQEGEIILLTSHLLYPNFITRLSRYSQDTMYVIHSHQDIVSCSDNILYKCFIRWLYNNQKIIGISRAVCNELKKKYMVMGRTMEIIENPLNFTEIDSKMQEDTDFEYPYILFCGRLSKIKRPDRIVNAFYHGKFFKKYHLVILGIGEWKEKLEKLVEEYGIKEQVHILGWETNVFRWLKAAKLLVLTSESEGSSMIIMEALYCGCPVVSVECNGPAEILTGKLKDFLCAPNVEALVEKMWSALEHYPSGLRKYTEKFSIENNIEKYLAVYREWNANT